MALDTAAGPASLAEDALATMLSECAAFREILGAANAAAALAKTYFGALPSPAGEEYTAAEAASLIPYALIKTPTHGLTLTATGPGRRPTASGSVNVDLVSYDDAALTLQENYRRWLNRIGSLMSEIWDETEAGGTLDIIGVRLVETDELDEDEQRTGLGRQADEDSPFVDRWYRTLTVSWSAGSP